MLSFFRKNQRFFFFFVTGAIVVTFVFFGTFQTTPQKIVGDQKAFTALDGSEVSRADLQLMTSFLSTDIQDQSSWGIVWGPNFLNDGALVKDLLQSGLAEMLAADYMDQLKPDLDLRKKKEKSFRPYVHPEAKFLSAQTVWAYFAPNLRESFEAMSNESGLSDEDAFHLRANLFLEEKKFPAPFLKHVLRLQEQQYNWIAPDPGLLSYDMTLFGYKTAEDWFGRRFLELASQFVINASILAEQKGYCVSKEEVLADFIRNSKLSFERNKNHPDIGVDDSWDYYKEQLRRMNIDQATAVSIWRKVMLFRRLFDDVGNAVFMDVFSYRKFYRYAKEKILIDLYRLPDALRFSDYRDWQKFEAYLDIVSPKRGRNLVLPGNFLPLEEVEKSSPELVARRYLIKFFEADKRDLQVKVGVKEMWDWELSEENWATLTARYPEMQSDDCDTREKRFAVLENLDANIREKIDREAKEAIVDKHQEWMEEAFAFAEEKTLVASISEKGGNLPFSGISDRRAFISLLDAEPFHKEENAEEKYIHYSGDGFVHYRIMVLDRDDAKHVRAFSEACDENVLDEILDSRLRKYYEKMQRRGLSGAFLTDRGLAKPFDEVKNLVADSYFDDRIQIVYDDYLSYNQKGDLDDAQRSGVFCAFRRFDYFVRSVREALKEDPEQEANVVQRSSEETFQGKLSPIPNLQDQWRLKKEEVPVRRKSRDLLDSELVFSMNLQDWSNVFSPVNGDTHFFQVKQRISEEGDLDEKVDFGQKILSNDARRFLMKNVLKIVKDKKAISFEYYESHD